MAGEEPDTAAAAGGKLDDASITQVDDAAKGLRTTAKGTAAAVAALGTTIGGAITFTGLTELDGDRFWWGAAGLALVVAAAAIVIVVVGHVLTPTNVPLAEADGDCGAARLIPGMLLGHNNVREFAEELTESEALLANALLTEQPTDIPARVRERAALYGARAERIGLIAHFFELRRRWRRGQLVLVVGALVVTGGVVMYEHAASGQHRADQLPPAFLKTPDLIVRFTPGKLNEEARCAGARRGVRVPNSPEGQAVMLLRPKGTCPGALVRVDAVDVTTTAAPVPRATRP